MSDQRVNRVGRTARSGGGGGYTILTITDNGFGASRVTTAGPHGLTTNVNVVISGNSVVDYNTTHPMQAVVSARVFDTDVAYTTDGVGGTWRFL